MRSSGQHKGFISRGGCFSQQRENRIKHRHLLTTAERTAGLEEPGVVWSMAKGRALPPGRDAQHTLFNI